MNRPTEAQLNYIAKLLGMTDNRFHSAAWGAIARETGASEKKATKTDASETIDRIKAKKSA